MRLWLLLLLAMQVGVGSAQTASTAPATPMAESFEQRLAAARTTWQRSGAAEYVYGFNKFCECHRETPPETLVSVSAGAITDVRHVMAKTGDTVPAAARNFDLYWTVDDLFALLDRALTRGATVRATFDDEFGLPRQLFIDYLPDVIGDEVDVRITRFERG